MRRMFAEKPPRRRNYLWLVVGESQVSVCAQQCVFGFLQMVDRFVYLIDGPFEAVGCQVAIARMT